MKKYLLLFAGLTIGFVSCEKDEIADLNAQLEVEKIAREQGDATLQANLNSIEATLTQAIADEASAREAGDVALADALSSAVALLNDAIQAEEAARIAGDEYNNELIDALSAALDAEVVARIAGDHDLSLNLQLAVSDLAFLMQARRRSSYRWRQRKS